MKAYNYVIKYIFKFANNATGRLIPQLDDLANNEDVLNEVRTRVSIGFQILTFVVIGFVLGAIIYAIKSIINNLKSKR